MKMTRKLLMSLSLLLWAGGLMAQDIKVTDFGQNPTSLIAKMNPVMDNAGNGCAVIRFYIRGEASEYTIEPNLGSLRQEALSGEIRVWVPKGTKRITIRHTNSLPLRGYKIPISLESKCDYEAVIEVSSAMYPTYPDEGYGWGSNGPRKNVTKQDVGHPVYISAGFNAMSIMGPSAAVGFDLSHHNIELGAVYGLNKSDDWYFYDSEGNVSEAYSYQAIRVQLRYGYEIKVADFLGLIPQVGVGYNILTGKTVGGISSSKSAYKSSGSLSALGALRLVASFSESFKLHITPEYDFGAYRDNTCKAIEKKDNKFKSWTEGFNLNVGLMIFF